MTIKGIRELRRACALAAVLVAAGTTPAWAAGGVSFGPAAVTPDGNFPVGTATGDFNGDGRPDVVVANNRDTLSVFLNTTPAGATTPSFAPEVDFSTGVGSAPGTPAVADVNADGKPDLVVPNGLGSDVEVLINTTVAGARLPSFATATTFAVPSVPAGVAVADFNGDGLPDIVATGYSSPKVFVLLNTTSPGAGTPTFAAHVDFGTEPYPTAVTTGDFNGDGKPDVALSYYQTADVSVLLNETTDGAATPAFAARSNFATAGSEYGIAAADFDRDGRPDLASASIGGSVYVLLNGTPTNAATPTFATAGSFEAGVQPQGVAAGDFDGDGRPDLVTGNVDGKVSVLLDSTAGGASSPSFGPATSFVASNSDSPSAYQPAVADFNGDGKPDIAIATDAGLAVLLDVSEPAASLSASSIDFGAQPLDTLAPPHAVTVTNTGQYPLRIGAVRITGGEAADFVLAGDGCSGTTVAEGASCALQVRFAPAAAGQRSATLTVSSDDPAGARQVALTGTGGALPQGPQGTAGPQGAPGARGAVGPAGKIEIVTCRTVTKRVKRHGKRRKVKQQKCTAKLVSGPVKFTRTPRTAKARITRQKRLYATGSATTAHGRTRLRLHPIRRLPRGRYVLTLTRRHHGRASTTRQTLVVSDSH